MYIDADNSAYTGYQQSGGGFEYLIENGNAYIYTGTGTDWSYNSLNAQVTLTTDNNYIRCRIRKNDLTLTTDEIKLMAVLVDSSWNNRKEYPIISVPFTSPKIEGFQISYLNKGLRCLYTADVKYGEKSVIEFGLIYGIDLNNNLENQMTINNSDNRIRAFSGTEEHGRYVGSSFESQNRNCYVMTMRFYANTPAEFTHRYYVRAYEKLDDGSYVYSDVQSFTIYDIAQSIINKGEFSSTECYNYLQNSIIKVVNPN